MRKPNLEIGESNMLDVISDFQILIFIINHSSLKFSLSPPVDLIMKLESFSNKADRCSKI
mgnify:CR=1 FL=1